MERTERMEKMKKNPRKLQEIFNLRFFSSFHCSLMKFQHRVTMWRLRKVLENAGWREREEVEKVKDEKDEKNQQHARGEVSPGHKFTSARGCESKNKLPGHIWVRSDGSSEWEQLIRTYDEYIVVHTFAYTHIQHNKPRLLPLSNRNSLFLPRKFHFFFTPSQ